MRRVLAILAAGGVVAGVVGCGGDDGGGGGGGESSGGPSGKVVMMLPNTTTVRFVQHDGPRFVEAMKKLAPNVDVELVNADGDANKQLQQTESVLTQDAKAIVLVAADPNLASGILTKVDQAGIPLISYEHEAVGGPVTYQAMFDPYKVGVEQGRYAAEKLGKGQPKTVMRLYGNKGDNYTTQDLKGQNDQLKAAIDEGKIEVACEAYTPGWDPAKAQNLTEQCLTKTGNKLDAIIAMNDGTASGAIAALEGQKLAGDIPVYGGQDANLEAVQYILSGQQASTVLKPYGVLAEAAAKLTVAALEDKKPESGLVNATFDNQAEKVPAAFLPVESIDETNVQKVVDAGLYKWEEICKGAAAKSATCREQM
jgi:ABC-type xylose transport system substrate-binding protein